MGLRNVLDSSSLDPFKRMAQQINSMVDEISRLRSIVRRDCLKARGYELEHRQLPVPGLYLVNKIDGDANFGVATFIGP